MNGYLLFLGIVFPPSLFVSIPAVLIYYNPGILAIFLSNSKVESTQKKVARPKESTTPKKVPAIRKKSKPLPLNPSDVLRTRFNIKNIYHFTDTRNIELIRHKCGLFSWAEIRNQVPAPGGNEWSHDADKLKKLETYVHLCFLPNHPMEYRARSDGRIFESKFLKIDLTIIDIEGVLFTDDVSNKAGVNTMKFEDALDVIDFNSINLHLNHQDRLENEKWVEISKYEILIPNHVPSKYILDL